MKKILVIEDNRALLENTAALLGLSNYQVVTANSGKKGVEVAIKERPDLILCNMAMPEVDGYGVLHQINTHHDLSHTPFIFLSAINHRHAVKEGLLLGADDFLVKPFTPFELLNAVQKRLQQCTSVKKEMARQASAHTLNGHSLSLDRTMQLFIEGRPVSYYKKKQMVYFEGNRPLYLFFVQTGKAKTFKTNKDGKELITGLYNTGEFFGYVSMLDGLSYKDTAQVVEDTALIMIPKTEFEELIHNNADVSKKFMKQLAHSVIEKEQQLINIAYSSLRQKVADALLLMKEKWAQKRVDGQTAIQLSRENMAAVAGTATESFIRTLTEFKNEKLIDIQEGCVIIIDEAQLRNLRN